MQLRLKKHRWHRKVLKTRDPLLVSVGWRRFQTVPVFALEDSNGRQRMLKYTPEHMHCLAAVWGALAPPGCGMLALAPAADKQVRGREREREREAGEREGVTGG